MRLGFQSTFPRTFSPWTGRALTGASRGVAGYRGKAVGRTSQPRRQWGRAPAGGAVLSSCVRHSHLFPHPRSRAKRWGRSVLVPPARLRNNQASVFSSSAQKMPISYVMVLVSGNRFSMQWLEDSGLVHVVGPLSFEDPEIHPAARQGTGGWGGVPTS